MSSIMAEVVGCEYLWHVIGQWIPRGVDDPTWYQWEPWTSTNLEASMARMTQHRVLRSCQCSLSPSKNGFADGWIPFFHQIYFQIQLFCSHIFSFLPAQVSSIFLSVFLPIRNIMFQPISISLFQKCVPETPNNLNAPNANIPPPTSRQHAKRLLSPNAGGMSCPTPKKHRNSPQFALGFPVIPLFAFY